MSLPSVTHAAMRDFVNILRPFKWLVSPVFLGMEALPTDRAFLLVGNHTMFGVLDSPLLLAEIYTQKGLIVRAMGDRIHFRVPGWRELCLRHGVVEGSRASCGELLDRGEAVLVFPGGAREVAKRRGEKYKLVWKERVGFAKMAIRHGCPIVPFSAVGVDDAFDIMFDADELMATPLGRLVERLGVRTDVLVPFVKGWGPTPLPRPERQYFKFSEPIDAASFGDDPEDQEAVFALRDRARAAIEEGITQLLAYRDDDPYRSLSSRVRRSVFGAGEPTS